MKQIYLDNAATTLVDPQVFESMKPYFIKKFGNPSEPHNLGADAKEAIETSRQKVAKFLGAKSSEIIFTGSATESINLSHKGLIESFLLPIRQLADPNLLNLPHIITSQIEHKAVLETCRHLEKLGWAKVTYLPVDKFGMISVEDVEKSLISQSASQRTLISLMYVNNEVGTIQPIPEIGKLIKKLNLPKERRIFFHTDATQAIPYLNCNVNFLGVDFLSFTGHKIYAPKGIGVLYKRESTPLVRQMDGGGQETNLRAGTENVPYIVGLGKAIELIFKSQVPSSKLLKVLQTSLISQIIQIPGVALTGHSTKRSPHIASFIVEGIEGEALVLYLAEQGIYASSGSACTSSSLQPSHVLSAMGIPAEKSHGSLRLSLGKNTTKQDLEYTIKILPKVISKLRRMAPKL